MKYLKIQTPNCMLTKIYFGTLTCVYNTYDFFNTFIKHVAFFSPIRYVLLHMRTKCMWCSVTNVVCAAKSRFNSVTLLLYSFVTVTRNYKLNNWCNKWFIRAYKHLSHVYRLPEFAGSACYAHIIICYS